MDAAGKILIKCLGLAVLILPCAGFNAPKRLHLRIALSRLQVVRPRHVRSVAGFFAKLVDVLDEGLAEGAKRVAHDIMAPPHRSRLGGFFVDDLPGLHA